jgi:hypothetical protein
VGVRACGCVGVLVLLLGVLGSAEGIRVIGVPLESLESLEYTGTRPMTGACAMANGCPAHAASAPVHVRLTMFGCWCSEVHSGALRPQRVQIDPSSDNFCLGNSSGNLLFRP